MARIGSWFKKAWGRIKVVAKKAWHGGKKIVKKIVEHAPKVFDTAKKVIGFLPSNKYTDVAKKIVNKSEEGYNTVIDKGKKIYDTGKKIVDTVKQAS